MTTTKYLSSSKGNFYNMQQQYSIYPVQKVTSTNNDEQQQQSIYPVQRETSTINDKQQQQNIYPVQRTDSSTNFKIFQFVFIKIIIKFI